MRSTLILLSLLILVCAALYTSPNDLRQDIAKYIFFCLIAALVIKPIGLKIGETLGTMIKKSDDQ